MLGDCNVELEKPTTPLDINDESNIELYAMKLNHTFRDTQELEEYINECDSSNINISNQQLNDQDMSIINHLAIIKKKCIDLKLGFNNITSDGIKILTDALHNNKNLERLNLYENKISDQGVYYLTEILSLNTSNLKLLYLGQNQITDIGVKYLSEMLKINKKLTQLGLSNNEITSQGVILLANALSKHNTTLKELSLWGNKLINDDCIDALADMLVYNRTLDKLILFDCNISDIGKDKLREVVQPRKDFGLSL